MTGSDEAKGSPRTFSSSLPKQEFSDGEEQATQPAVAGKGRFWVGCQIDHSCSHQLWLHRALLKKKKSIRQACFLVAWPDGAQWLTEKPYRVVPTQPKVAPITQRPAKAFLKATALHPAMSPKTMPDGCSCAFEQGSVCPELVRAAAFSLAFPPKPALLSYRWLHCLLTGKSGFGKVELNAAMVERCRSIRQRIGAGDLPRFGFA